MATLHMPVGVQGSGKSTWAKLFIAKNPDIVYVSPDNIWTSIGDIKDRSLGGQVYSIAMRKTREALEQNKDVLVDATFVKRKWRKSFIEIARQYKAKTVAYVFSVDRETAINRVQKRASNGGMNVPVESIDMYIGFLKNTPPDETEFDKIIYK